MSPVGIKRSASLVDDSDHLGETDQPQESNKRTRTARSATEPDGQDDEGNAYWELSTKRRVGVSKFKNMCFVNIREYYDKDGRMLPGKKGISLSIEQYNAFIKSVSGINAALREMGYEVEDLADGTAKGQTQVKPKAKHERPKSTKDNIEATSDEDEG